jgi:hypothetical protein
VECEQEFADLQAKEMKFAIQVQMMAKHQKKLDRNSWKQAMRQQNEATKLLYREKRSCLTKKNESWKKRFKKSCPE